MKLCISKEKGQKIPQGLIGLFFEDINFAADGGLYAEMLENRSFEAQEAFGTPGYFYAVDDHSYAWKTYAPAGTQGEPRMQIITGDPLAVENPHYLRLTTTTAGQGVTNQAFDGITLKKGMKYRLSFYARCVRFEGAAIIRIEKDGRTYGERIVELQEAAPYVSFADTDLPIPAEMGEFGRQAAEARRLDDGTRAGQNIWVRYEAELTAQEEVRGATFVLALSAAGAVDFDLISMMPEDAVEGIFRKDLFDALMELKPGFIRFPGGCIVEGVSLANRYQWKKTVGPLEHRKILSCLWAYDDERSRRDNLDSRRPDSHYMQSYGIGFYEYFLLCEKLGAKALPVLNMGIACQFRSMEVVPVDSPEIQEYVQDALDLIEFANGPVDSTWGALRASMGHPEPFGLEMMGIGNEQWESKHVDLYARHLLFEKAIHDRYPEMKLIGTAGPGIDMPFAGDAWKFYRDGKKENPGFAFAVDEHYYSPLGWMYDHVNHYDDYPREVAVFAGEYAAHTEDKQNTVSAALAEAALLTGIEKNADVVQLASYAPLFNRIGHSQWTPDMIWFDDAEVFLTPSYQVQKMYSCNLGDETIPMNGQEKELQKEQIYVSLSRTNEGETIVKAVNPDPNAYTLELALENGEPLCGAAVIQTLLSAGEKPEGMPESSEIKVTSAEIRGQVELPGESFSVIRVK